MNLGPPSLTVKDKAVLGCIGLMQLALVALKLFGVVRWHWALVLFPAEFFVAAFVAVVAVAIFRLLFDDY